MLSKSAVLAALAYAAYGLTACHSEFHVAFSADNPRGDIQLLYYRTEGVPLNSSTISMQPGQLMTSSISSGLIVPDSTTAAMPVFDYTISRWFFFFLNTPRFAILAPDAAWRYAISPVLRLHSATAGSGVVFASGAYDEHYVPSADARGKYGVFRAGSDALSWVDITTSLWYAAFEFFPGITISLLAPASVCHLDGDRSRFPMGVLIAVLFPCSTAITPTCGNQMDPAAKGVDGDDLFVGRMVVSTDGGLRWSRVQNAKETISAAAATGAQLVCQGEVVFWRSGADGTLRSFELVSGTDSVASGVTLMSTTTIPIPAGCLYPVPTASPLGASGGAREIAVACTGGGGLFVGLTGAGALAPASGAVSGGAVAAPAFSGGQWVTTVGTAATTGASRVAVSRTLSGPYAAMDGVSISGGGTPVRYGVGVSPCCPAYCVGGNGRAGCLRAGTGGMGNGGPERGRRGSTVGVGGKVECAEDLLPVSNAEDAVCTVGGVARIACFDVSSSPSLNIGNNWTDIVGDLLKDMSTWNEFVMTYPGASVRPASDSCNARCTPASSSSSTSPSSSSIDTLRSSARSSSPCSFPNKTWAPLCSPCLACRGRSRRAAATSGYDDNHNDGEDDDGEVFQIEGVVHDDNGVDGTLGGAADGMRSRAVLAGHREVTSALRQGVDDDSSALFMLCNQSSDADLRRCLEAAVCSGVINDNIICRMRSVDVPCPSCPGKSKKALIGLLGLLGLIPLCLTLCALCACVAWYVRAKRGYDDDVDDFDVLGSPDRNSSNDSQNADDTFHRGYPHPSGLDVHVGNGIGGVPPFGSAHTSSYGFTSSVGAISNFHAAQGPPMALTGLPGHLGVGEYPAGPQSYRVAAAGLLPQAMAGSGAVFSAFGPPSHVAVTAPVPMFEAVHTPLVTQMSVVAEPVHTHTKCSTTFKCNQKPPCTPIVTSTSTLIDSNHSAITALVPGSYAASVLASPVASSRYTTGTPTVAPFVPGGLSAAPTHTHESIGFRGARPVGPPLVFPMSPMGPASPRPTTPSRNRETEVVPIVQIQESPPATASTHYVIM